MLQAMVIFCGVLLGLLLAAILVASGISPLVTGLQHILADPWGVVTLLERGIGLVFIAGWLAAVEPRPLCAVLWIIALFILGNAVTLVFLLWRTRQVERFSELFLPSRRI